MQGRKPKPAALKLVDGNPGHRPIQEAPDVKPGIPPCPVHLTEIAKAEWDRIAPDLNTAQLLNPLYMAVLTGYCDAWGDYVHARLMLAKPKEEGGGFMVTTPNGYSVQSQWQATMNKAWERFMKASAELGITPTAMARLSGNASLPLFPEDDPMEALMRAAHGRTPQTKN